jgi:hypothetical protein
MSEAPARYVPCALDNNTHTDCQVARAGDLVKLQTERHVLLFLPGDATRLAVAINRIATDIHAEMRPPETGHTD